ncbi:MAG: hypothetical protein ACFE9C_00170 [Candidatus Hodarchaeota archaeon]
MVDFSNIKENLWVVSLVAGIIGVITLFIPAWGWTSGGSWSIVWLWNLYINDGNPNFIDLDEPLFAIGIVSTLIIAIGAVLLLFGGVFTKIKDREINLLYLIGGILTIVGIITFIAGAAGVYGGFWTIYYINVAGILPFIAGGLGIAAGVFGIIEKRKE